MLPWVANIVILNFVYDLRSKELRKLIKTYRCGLSKKKEYK